MNNMPTVKSYQKQKEKEQIAYNYFLSQGYSPEATAGIVGNLVYESGLNTSAEGDIGFHGGSSFGIAQFRGKRLQDLKKRYGNNWTDFGNQLDFVRHELETTHKKAGNILKNTRDVYQAGQTFSDLYEIPAKKYKNNPDRQKKVNKIYSSLSGITPTPISDQAISNVNNYFENQPTTAVKDLAITEENVNFDVEVAEEKVKDKDIEEVQKQTAEYNFLEEYKALVNQQQSSPEPVQIEQPVQQLPQQDLTEIYNQVSQFIDSPISAQQGGKVYVNSVDDPRYKAYLDSLKLYQGTQRTLDELKSKEYAQERDTKVGFVSTSALSKEKEPSRVGFGNNRKEGDEWFLTYDKELNLSNAKDYLKSAKIKPEKFYKSSDGDSYYRPIYKKPEQVVEVMYRPKLNRINSLESKDIVQIDPEVISSEAEILNQYIQPKYWDVQDNVNQDFGGSQTNYKVYPETADYMLNTIAPEPYNSRKVVPHYQTGGTIGNLTPQQTADIESQRQWINNWNKNRIIGGTKINTNSDIPFSSDIYVDDLNYGSNGREKTLGEFDNVSNRLVLDTNYQSKPGIPTHEFSHRYQKYVDPSIYSKYINEPISIALQNTQGSSEYHGNVDENQAELNRLRYNSGFKPNQVITPQDLQKYNADEYNLKHFSQEQLIDILNKTAYNENTNSQVYAQEGEVIKDQEGQRRHRGKVTEIQGNTMSTEGYGNMPLYVVPDIGTPRIIESNTGEHKFPGATKFTEYPLTENEKEFLKYIAKTK